MTTRKPMVWIAYDPLNDDSLKNREQFNADKPAWGESEEDVALKQGVDVPHIGDEVSLRMGIKTVCGRRLEQPEFHDDGTPACGWYWTVLVR